MNLKTNIADKGNYGGSRSLSSIKYIVIHYTANDGDTDENNGIYFHNNDVDSSAHYFVDDDSVTQSVPDNYIAWHCGANVYKHKDCRNANSIGIEICDDVRNGVIYPSDKTIQNVLELTEYLMKKYSVPKDNVIRHYDVTGKLCPAYWCGSTAKNAKWKTEFWNKINSNSSVSSTPSNTDPVGTIYRVQVGAYGKIANAEAQLKNLKKAGFDAFIVEVDNLYKVQVGAYTIKSNAEAQLNRVKSEGFTGFITTKGGKAVSVSATATTRAITEGSTVRVNQGAKDFNGKTLADFVYTRNHKVKEITGNRVVITHNGVIVAAVHKNDLTLV